MPSTIRKILGNPKEDFREKRKRWKKSWREAADEYLEAGIADPDYDLVKGSKSQPDGTILGKWE